MSEDEIVDIAVSGAKLFDEYAAKMPETNFRFEYSPRELHRHGDGVRPADLQRRHRRVEAPAGRQVIINLPPPWRCPCPMSMPSRSST